MNKSLHVIPSVFFILLAMFWIAESYMSLGVIHYTAISVVVLLTFQLFHKQRYIGLLYSIVLTVFSGYMLCKSFIDNAAIALPTGGTFRFLIIKSILFGTALLMALVMLNYYFKIIKLKKDDATSV
ncbi:hypothetical protein [Flavobacterium rivuli]|nr:hypothetical protein [Flavobacterium rivuli]